MPGISIGASSNTTGLLSGGPSNSFEGDNARPEPPPSRGSWLGANGTASANVNNGNAQSASWLGGGTATATATAPAEPSKSTSWLGGGTANAANSNTAATAEPFKSTSWLGGGGGTPASFKMPKSKTDVAFSVATSMASSAASATAGAISLGAKAAKTAVVDRRNSAPGTVHNGNNNNGEPPMWKRMFRPNASAADATTAAAAGESPTSPAPGIAAPAWTQASSAPNVGGAGSSEYGVSDYGERATPTARQSMASAWNSRPRVSLPSFGRRHTAPTLSLDEGDEAEIHKALVDQSHLSLYGGLLSMPPSTITFVIRRRQTAETSENSENGDIDTEGSQELGNSGSSRQKLRDLLGVRLVKSPATNHRFQVVREDWQDDDDANETETETPPTPTADGASAHVGAPLLPPELTVLLRPGDFLESVDGIAVGGRRRMSLVKSRCGDEEGLYKTILSTTEASDPTQTSPNTQDESEAADGAEPASHGSEEEAHRNSNSKYHTTTLTFVCPSAATVRRQSDSSLPSTTDSTTLESSELSVSAPPSEEAAQTPSVTVNSHYDDSSSELKESAPKSSPKSSDNKVPKVHRAYFVDQSHPAEDTSMEDDILDHFLGLETVQKSIIDSPRKSRFSLGSKNKSPTHRPSDHHKVGTSLLHMGAIPEHHWLGKQTKIKEGDVVLCADDIPCYNGELSPGDLSLVWRTALLTKVLVSDPIQDAICSVEKSPTPYVGITTCTVPPTRLEVLRKSAVAATGGALVGTGAVLMVTPLHPVGHAMTIGGLGVLGTEFEGPRKAFQKAKQSASNLAAKVKQKQHPKGKNAEDASEKKSDEAEEVEETFISSH